MIVRHEITDITEAVYTQRLLSDFVKDVKLIDYSGDDLPDNAAGFEWNKIQIICVIPVIYECVILLSYLCHTSKKRRLNKSHNDLSNPQKISIL